MFIADSQYKFTSLLLLLWRVKFNSRLSFCFVQKKMRTNFSHIDKERPQPVIASTALLCIKYQSNGMITNTIYQQFIEYMDFLKSLSSGNSAKFKLNHWEILYRFFECCNICLGVLIFSCFFSAFFIVLKKNCYFLRETAISYEKLLF